MKILDMHCDTIMALMDSNEDLYDSKNMIDILKMKKGNYLLQCFAMFVRYVSDKEGYSPFNYCNKMIDKYYTEIEKYKDYILPAFTSEDIENNIKKGKMSAVLTIEEGGVCLGNIEFLRNFYRLGVRMITLTWNYKNELATPNIDYFTDYKEKLNNKKLKQNVTDGLTKKGIEFVEEMNKLGIVIDCSHLGDKGFYDVIKYSKKPIVCSHSCVRSLCNHLRNMTDDMLFKLKQNGGVVGINYCNSFIKEDGTIATIKDIVKHIVYIKEIIGIDYVGLGSDFDGISNENIELKDASMMGLLVDELRNQGFTEDEIDKVCYKNVLRVFKENF